MMPWRRDLFILIVIVDSIAHHVVNRVIAAAESVRLYETDNCMYDE